MGIQSKVADDVDQRTPVVLLTVSGRDEEADVVALYWYTSHNGKPGGYVCVAGGGVRVAQVHNHPQGGMRKKPHTFLHAASSSASMFW